MSVFRCLLTLSLIAMLAEPCPAVDKRKTGRTPDVPIVPLPADYDLDLRLAISGHERMMMGAPSLVDSFVSQSAREVFDSLVANCAALPYPWKLTLVNNDVVNASSNPAGQVYAYGGMAKVLGSHTGLWAAVLSHEIAHTALRHQVQLYVQRLYLDQQIRYYRRLAAAGDKAANWTVVGLTIAGPIALNKLSRDLEHQADAAGMLLMARSGYHPDLVFALHHRLRMATGEQSKLGAFFSGHPRWATRDQRSERAYADALAEFNRRWPDGVASPGGLPPPIAFIGDPTSRENKAMKTADVGLQVSCQNATEPITLVIHFAENRGAWLVPDVRQTVECTEAPRQAEIRIPASLTTSRERKLKAHIAVLSPEGNLIETSKQFDIRIPKP